MIKSKKLILIILMLLIIVMIVSACGANRCITYTFIANIDGYQVSCTKQTRGSITIADSYDDGVNGLKPVRKIADEAFYSKKIKSIIIPETITSIGNNAFTNCASLTTISIPSSVTSIGYNAFWQCYNLESITFEDDSQLLSISSGTFYDCNSLITISIPYSVTSIGDGSFSLCSNMTSITIPSNVISIGSMAFYVCSSLTTVFIERPSSVGITTGGANMFDNCSDDLIIYVPDSASETAYRAASGWSSYADKIQVKPEE